jgi:hypothetical protein
VDYKMTVLPLFNVFFSILSFPPLYLPGILVLRFLARSAGLRSLAGKRLSVFDNTVIRGRDAKDTASARASWASTARQTSSHRRRQHRSAQHNKAGTGRGTSTASAAATTDKENNCCSAPASKEKKKRAIVELSPAAPTPAPVMEDKLLVMEDK